MRRRPEAGFTLVEVMVATVVLSLILLTTLSAMRTLAQVDKKVQLTTARVDEMRSVSEAVRSMLNQAHSGSSAAGSGGTWSGLQRLQSAYFEGSSRTLVWMAPLSGASGVSGLHYLRLRQQRGELLLDIADYEAENLEPDWSRIIETSVLVTDLADLDMAYRVAADETWQASFDNDNGALPQAIRVRIRARDRYWPDLVVAPAAYQAVN